MNCTIYASITVVTPVVIVGVGFVIVIGYHAVGASYIRVVVIGHRLRRPGSLSDMHSTRHISTRPISILAVFIYLFI